MKRRTVLFLAFPTVAFAQQKSTTPLDGQGPRIRRIEQNVAAIPLGKGEHAKQYGLVDLMAVLGVPGVSVAVFDDYKILWAKGYGVMEAGTSKPVTTQTLFQAGDVSAAVAAAGTLALVEQSRLSLDRNVNEELRSWTLPDNELTQTEKVTLRRLLSHTAGLTAVDLRGYAPSDPGAHSGAEPVPTIPQILDGQPPATNAAVRVEMVPGTKLQYTSADATIEQLIVSDVVGKPFPEAMHDLVLGKAGMNESTFEQSLPPARLARAAVGTRLDGTPVAGKHRIYPDMAAHGLWTTPSDLARFAIEIASSANGRSNKILSQKMTQLMLSPQIADGTRHMGLAFFQDDTIPGEFGLDAGIQGFQAMLMASSAGGRGFVIMANSEHGIDVGTYLVPAILREYGWRFPAPRVQAETIIRAIMSARSLDAALDWFRDFKASGSTDVGYGEYTLNRVGYLFLRRKDPSSAIAVFTLNAEMYPGSANVYDSLGEAYVAAGEKNLAVRSYARSLELNPRNDHAAAMLERLKRP